MNQSEKCMEELKQRVSTMSMTEVLDFVQTQYGDVNVTLDMEFGSPQMSAEEVENFKAHYEAIRNAADATDAERENASWHLRHLAELEARFQQTRTNPYMVSLRFVDKLTDRS